MILRGYVTCDLAQADLSAVAEVQAWLARRGVQGNEPRIQGRFENSPAAGFPFGSRRVQPRRHPAIDQAVAVVSGEFDHRIVNPALLSGFRIECKYTIEPRGKVQRAIYQDRGWFQATALLAAAAVGNIAHMKSPGDLQRCYILAIDLR